MLGLLTGALGKIGMRVVTALLTKKVLEKLMFNLMDWFVKRTDNKLDDEAVAFAKKAYYGSDK
jgi:hypothetical protein